MRGDRRPGDHERDVDRRGDPRGAPRPNASAASQNRDQGPEAFLSEALGIVEINADERIVAFVTFDLDDIDAAFAELEARYLAGEAAAHAQTWSLVVAAYAAFDRHELPAADWVTVDHRRATPFASSTMTETLRAIWDLTPALKIHIEAVHRLNSFGAVITHEGHGSSQEGFDAEWRAIDFLTVEGDRITGCEIFDEADLDAALARFEELQPTGTGGWKTRQAKWPSASERTSRQATGMPRRRYWPTAFQVTIAVGWWAQGSDMVVMPRS